MVSQLFDVNVKQFRFFFGVDCSFNDALQSQKKKIGYCRNLLIFSIPYRQCSSCRKKRSLRSNSFFEEFPKVALGKFLLTIYFFTADDSQRRIARHLGLNPGLVSRICRRLQDVCSRDLQDRSILPFGGPVVKCDESKFNHKPKVTPFYYLFLQFLSSFTPGKLFAFRNRNCPRKDVRSHFRAKRRLIFIQPLCFNFAGIKMFSSPYCAASAPKCL